MNTTSYFSIQLPVENAQDWVSSLNAAISRVTEKMVRLQMPAGTTLRWGDIAGGHYLEATALGVVVVGGLNHGATPGSNFRLPQGEAFPAEPGLGELFFKTDEPAVYYFDGEGWVLFSGVTDTVITTAGGVLVTDYGSTKGNFLVRNAGGTLSVRAPGADGTVLRAKASTTTGWEAVTAFDLIGALLTKGQLVVGTGSGHAQGLSPGADGTVLSPLASEPTGYTWVTVASLLSSIVTAKGQLVGFGTGPTAVPAPTAPGQVLIADPASPTGVRWANQSELTSVAERRTRDAADYFNYLNFI